MGFCSSQAQIFPVYHILHKSFLFSSGPSKSVLGAPANNKRFVMQWEPSSPVCLFPGNLFQVGWWLVPGGSFCLHMKEEPCFEVFHFELGFGNWNRRKWRSAVSVPSQHRSGEISPLRKAAKGLEHQLEPALFCFSLLFISRGVAGLLQIRNGENTWSWKGLEHERTNNVNSSEQQHLSEFNTCIFSSVPAFSEGALETLSVTILHL